MVRAGVLGAGMWAIRNHIPVLAARPEVELVGVCRVGAEPLARVKEEFGFAVASERYEDIVDLGLDAVVVSSPAAFHFEHAKAALESGANVLVEKPFTMAPADAWELTALAERLQRQVVVAFGYNWMPMVQDAERLLRERSIGEVRHMAVRMSSDVAGLIRNGRYPARVDVAGYEPDPRTWADPGFSGGGYAPGQLSHALGIALRLTGLRAREVFAYTSTDDTSVDLFDALSVRYETGATGTVSGAVSPPGWLRDQLEVRLSGTEGQLILDVERPLVSCYYGPGDEVTLPLDEADGAYRCDGPPNALVDLTLGLTEHNPAPAELGARTVELISAALGAAEAGLPVRL